MWYKNISPHFVNHARKEIKELIHRITDWNILKSSDALESHFNSFNRINSSGEKLINYAFFDNNLSWSGTNIRQHTPWLKDSRAHFPWRRKCDWAIWFFRKQRRKWERNSAFKTLFRRVNERIYIFSKCRQEKFRIAKSLYFSELGINHFNAKVAHCKWISKNISLQGIAGHLSFRRKGWRKEGWRKDWFFEGREWKEKEGLVQTILSQEEKRRKVLVLKF